MKHKNTETFAWLRRSVIRLSRIHFIFAIAYAVQIVLYDLWKLVTPEMILRRWIAAALLFIATTIVWYIARSSTSSNATNKWLVWALIVADIAMASFNVYYQRGMASRAVLLFIIPIIVSATLLSRSAILATAALCIAVYSTTALAYFVLNFNEGLKIELYGEVGFYCTMFMVVAALTWSLVKSTRKI